MHAGETCGRETPRIAGAPQIWNEPPFSPPLLTLPGDKRFLRKANALFSLPQLPLENQFLANSFFLSFEDRWRTRSRLWNRPISVVYLQGTFKTMNSTNRRNIGILEKWREKVFASFCLFFIQIIRWINKSRRGMKMIAFDETIKSEEFLRNILFYSNYSNRVAKGKIHRRQA